MAFLLGAGEGGSTTISSTSPTLVPTSTIPVETPTTPSPTATEAPQPTEALQPSATITPTVTPDPTLPSPTIPATPDSLADLQTSFTGLGFSLAVSRGAEIQSLGEPGQAQGAITFQYGNVGAILSWFPQGDSLISLMSGIYGVMREGQPDLTFETLTEGDLVVDTQTGAYLGFRSQDSSGLFTGGLIGSWDCPDSLTTYTLVLTGVDPVLVQIRFNELLANFACLAS